MAAEPGNLVSNPCRRGCQSSLERRNNLGKENAQQPEHQRIVIPAQQRGKWRKSTVEPSRERPNDYKFPLWKRLRAVLATAKGLVCVWVWVWVWVVCVCVFLRSITICTDPLPRLLVGRCFGVALYLTADET